MNVSRVDVLSYSVKVDPPSFISPNRVRHIFPAHACLSVCSVPTGVSVEEALRLLRENRRDPWPS